MTTGNLRLHLRRALRPVTAEQLQAVSFHHSLKKIVDECGSNAKAVAIDADIDDGQLSKMQTGQAGIIWDKLNTLMDVCGSELPLMWMIAQRGYDPASLRKRETELERRLRESEAALAAKDAELDTIKKFVRDTRTAA